MTFLGHVGGLNCFFSVRCDKKEASWSKCGAGVLAWDYFAFPQYVLESIVFTGLSSVTFSVSGSGPCAQTSQDRACGLSDARKLILFVTSAVGHKPGQWCSEVRLHTHPDRTQTRFEAEQTYFPPSLLKEKKLDHQICVLCVAYLSLPTVWPPSAEHGINAMPCRLPTHTVHIFYYYLIQLQMGFYPVAVVLQ